MMSPECDHFIGKIQIACARLQYSPKQKERILDDTCRLGDVILALSEARQYWPINVRGGMAYLDPEITWNLRRDNLKRQPPETVEWLAKRLSPPIG